MSQTVRLRGRSALGWSGAIPWILLLTLAHAGESTNREIAHGFALEEWRMQDYSAALKTLQEHLSEDPDDYDARILMGQVLLSQKQSRQAALIFREVALKLSAKDRGVALYHLADSFARMGQREEAKKTLLQASRDPRLKVAVQVALKRLKAGEPLPPLEMSVLARNESPTSEPPAPNEAAAKRGWASSLAVQAGYDSNVLLSSETALASASATEASSPMGTLSGALSYQGNTLRFDQAIAMSYFSQSSAKEFNSIQLTASQAWDPSPTDGGWSLRNDAVVMALNLSGYQYFLASTRVLPQWSWIQSKTSQTRVALPFAYQDVALAEGVDESNSRSGPIAGVDVEQLLGWGSWQFTFGANFERLFSEGANFVSNTGALRFSVVRPDLFWRTSLYLGLDWSSIAYVTSELNREDQNTGLSFALFRRFGKSFGTQVLMSYRNNASSVSDGNYQKMTTSFGVNYEF